MNVEKELGYIESADFGYGGYQDVQLGLRFALNTKSGSVQDFIPMEKKEHVQAIFSTAKKNSVSELKGAPIEALFLGNVLKNWRVLAECIHGANV